MLKMVPLVVLFVSLILGIHVQCEEIESSTPPAPVTGNLGGTKSDRIALFLEFLNKGTAEQKAAFNDDNPVLKEVHKEFNKTLQAIVNGYSVHKAMLSSSNEECDHAATEKADLIMKKAFDDIFEYLIQFRQRVRSEVKSDITDIRDVEETLRGSLLLPVDEGFAKVKLEAFEQFGHNTAHHLICVKNIKIKAN